MRTQMTLTWQGDDVDVDIEFSPGVHRPACLTGHPDNQTPDESEPPEITSIKISDTGEEILHGLSSKEISKIESKLVDGLIDDEPEPDYEPDDIGDDDWQDAQSSWEKSHDY